jgi:hypothetical protein
MFFTVKNQYAPAPAASNKTLMYLVVGVAALVILAQLGSVIGLAFKVADNNNTSNSAAVAVPTIVVNVPDPADVAEFAIPTIKPPTSVNVCAGKKPDVPNVDCIVDAMVTVGPQSGANVTLGYNGELNTTSVPITDPYWKHGMCPVNVHWHLGAEHYSLGEYDETGDGPEMIEESDNRRLAAETRQGYQCTHYDERDEKFTKPFDWKHCKDMEVGQTYEVHWPHSAAGACGTPNQYQTPFYDGVFCTDDVLTDTAAQIGVQAQIFTVVNDEAYYWPDLMRGMIVEGEKGTDIAYYTGSTTGTSRDNEVCSQFSPITWQVDRKCHLVSASTFDKMCADMSAQRDDMSDDLHAHGSRELVADFIAANNHQRRALRAAN